MEEDVTRDKNHQTLATRLLIASCAAQDVEVVSVDYAERDADARWSRLTYIADPKEGDHVAPLTERSALDHFRLADSTQFHRNAGTRLRFIVYEIALSRSADIPITLDDGTVGRFFPFPSGLAIARADFNYWPV
jgi:hypothetical protein